MGDESAWLKVEAENRRAIDFYLRHGFTRIGSTDFLLADQAYETISCEQIFGIRWTGPRRRR